MNPLLVDAADIAAPPLHGREELLVGVLLCDRPVLRRWFDALNNLRSPVPKGTLIAQGLGNDKLKDICASRQLLVDCALGLGHARYLFFLDDDVIVTPNTLEELLAAMRSATPRPGVVGGIYKGRGNVDRAEWQVWNSRHEWYTGDQVATKPFRCGGLAMGAMLIDLQVFARLKRPYFRFEATGTRVTQGEDEIFCDAVRATGVSVLAHGGLRLEHVDARVEASDFKGKDPWSVRYFNGRYIDQAGNTLRKSELGGSI